jgi:hypothetical protein
MRGCLVTTEDSERRTKNEKLRAKNKDLRTTNLELALPHSAVGIAEVDARLVASGLGGFAFLFLVFGEFLVGVGERVARGEHGVGTAGLFLLLAQGAEFMADLTDGTLDGLHFDEQVADFFEKVVKMVGTKYVGKSSGFQMDNVLAAG